MTIHEYLKQNTAYSLDAVNVIESTISAVSELPIAPEKRADFLREILSDGTFSDEEIACFAVGKTPEQKYELVPVDTVVQRSYIVWVRVPKGSDSDAVKEAARKQIINEGLSEEELDPGLDIEEEDICGMDVDWEGAYDEDE